MTFKLILGYTEANIADYPLNEYFTLQRSLKAIYVFSLPRNMKSYFKSFCAPVPSVK